MNKKTIVLALTLAAIAIGPIVLFFNYVRYELSHYLARAHLCMEWFECSCAEEQMMFALIITTSIILATWGLIQTLYCLIKNPNAKSFSSGFSFCWLCCFLVGFIPAYSIDFFLFHILVRSILLPLTLGLSLISAIVSKKYGCKKAYIIFGIVYLVLLILPPWQVAPRTHPLQDW